LIYVSFCVSFYFFSFLVVVAVVAVVAVAVAAVVFFVSGGGRGGSWGRGRGGRARSWRCVGSGIFFLFSFMKRRRDESSGFCNCYYMWVSCTTFPSE
jgi:hypothetical protein